MRSPAKTLLACARGSVTRSRHALLLFLFCLLAAAQQTPQPPAQRPGINPAEGVVKFESTSTLIVETVTVLDKNGKPIEGLTDKDFTVTEDGVPQTVRLCEFQSLPTVSEDSAGTLTARADPPAPPAAAPKPEAAAEIKPETPGEMRYRDRRLLVLYFDMASMPPPDQLRAFAAAEKYLTRQITPADLVAIMRFSEGAVRVSRTSPTTANCSSSPCRKW